MNLKKTVGNLVQKAEHRFYGKYRGVVVNNADPEHLGRLKLNVPSVLGNDVVTGWAMACVPYGGDADQGFLFIPEVDAGVWVEFEEGDLEFPIWVGTFWSKSPGGESEVPKPNGAAQDLPTQKIIKTKKGHTIQIEDADGDEKIIIKHKDNSYLSINKDGSVIIGNQNGSTIILNAKDKNMMLVEQHGNTIKMADDGVLIVNNGGGAIELSGTETDTMARVAANKIILQGTSVVLGTDDQVPSIMEPTIMGTTFSLMWNSFIYHTHPTALGPSGPPVPVVGLLAPGTGLTFGVAVK